MAGTSSSTAPSIRPGVRFARPHAQITTQVQVGVEAAGESAVTTGPQPRDILILASRRRRELVFHGTDATENVVTARPEIG